MRINVFLMGMFVVLLTACTKIPQESVNLSNEVGAGLQKQHQSQIDLVNLYFSFNRKRLDEMMERGMDRYFGTLFLNDSATLNKSQLADMVKDIIMLNKKNNAAKEELEKARIFFIKKLNENYAMLRQANSSVTKLLKSSATTKKGKSESYSKSPKVYGEPVDMNKMFSELDDFVLKNGEESGESIRLVEKLEHLLNKDDN